MTTPTCQSLIQNQRILQIQNPPTRYNPPNPYLSGYKQFQLNMRRKAEILRYDPIRQPGQTNSLTKSQRWAQVVSGKFQTQSYTKIRQSDGTTTINGIPVNPNAQYIPLNCPDNKVNVPTPTSASNVPGPVIQLYNDGTTPIYMLASKKDPYAIPNPTNPTVYYSQSYNNVSSTYVSVSGSPYFENYTSPKTFASLYVVNPINDTMTFSMSLPISIYVGGSVKYAWTGYSGSSASTVTVNITGITLSALYGSTIYTISPTHTFQYYMGDVSFNILPTNTTFFASSSIGQLKIANIQLPTIAGYIFDFQLAFKVSVRLPDKYSEYFNAASAGVVCNVTQDISFNATTSIPQSIGPVFSISSS